jgi:prolyl 4-hydroxylase
MYLNDGYVGGQTHFPELDISFEPKAGDALVFDGLNADGSVNKLSRHAGLPVLQGQKWVATRWIRQHRFDPWTSSKGDSVT